MKADHYRINRYLDEQRRLIGLALDECIPMLMFLVLGFCLRQIMVSIILMMGWFVLIRILKKGKGSAALLVTLYWHMVGSPYCFQGLPDSTQRVWS